jgi:hypothetical protein
MVNATVAVALSVAWLLLIGFTARRILRRVLGVPRLVDDVRTRAVLLLLLALCVTGVTWGLPGPSWAPDEFDAGAVRRAFAQRFAGGWTDKYPPLHFAVLGVSAAPVLAAEQAGLLAPAVRVDDVLILQFRLVSLLMGAGCLVLVAALNDRIGRPAPDWLAVLCAGAFLPFVFYAKTANLDVPYAFWLLLSFVFLADAHRLARPRDFVALGVTAALAVATKDQAYGFYVLPAVHLLWRTRQARMCAVGAAAALVTFLVVHNVAFNPAGFAGHFRELLGPASANYRMFPMSVEGQVGLLAATAECVLLNVGWAGLVLLAAGLGTRSSAPPVWIGLALLSYYVTFIAPAGYVYDRFLLPATLLLSPVAAGGAHRLASSRALGARRRLFAAAAVAMLVWRAASVDVLLLRDARYDAETWLAQRAAPGASVGYTGMMLYLPRLAPYNRVLLDMTVEQTLALRPDFIVVNTEWMKRFEPGTPRRLWFEWLERGTGPYRLVFRYKDPLRGTALAWTRRFTDRVEDPLTNLDKANPETAIFEFIKDP